MSQKSLLKVQSAPSHGWVGDGFQTRTLFTYRSNGIEVSPFLMFDYAGPTRFGPTDQPRGVGAHPHRGFETVSVVWQGELEHRDSFGNSGSLGAGDVQWMTAGNGLLHEEMHSRRFAQEGGTLEMAQIWVNLPAEHKRTAPGYQDLAASTIPNVTLSGGTARVIAGSLNRAHGPAKTFTPVTMLDLSLEPGTVEIPVPEGQTALLMLRTGRVRAGESVLQSADLAIFGLEGDKVRLEVEEAAQALLIGGEPIREPVVGHGPFAMNTFDEIRESVEMFQSGAMGRLD